MKRLFLVSTLVLAVLASCLEVPALARSVNSDSVKKSPTVSVSKTKSKPKAKTKTKVTTKSKTKAKSKAKTKTKSKAKSKSKTSTKKQTQSKIKKTSTKTANKRKTASRGENTQFDTSRILALGMSLRGTPYKFGASSPKGFDCSGFTSYVFKNAAGITLPRTSRGQASAGVHVDKTDLQPGDLVYFNTNGSGISHVGIYTGGGKFIHASRTKGITVTNLNDSYYKPRYLGATRVR
ncbi:MAG TPA: C40 family peptidase [Desulfobacteria bacterium]|nr:C40 family peptidase [Desulfobacteria bacterium]